jgi:hypothetical protein
VTSIVTTQGNGHKKPAWKNSAGRDHTCPRPV